jgi:hypothetical protein
MRDTGQNVNVCRLSGLVHQPDGVRGGASTEPDGSDRMERVDEFQRANERDIVNDNESTFVTDTCKKLWITCEDFHLP